MGQGLGRPVIGLLVGLGVITVSPAGPVRSLSAGVALARAGDTVIVTAGRYQEQGSIRIERPLTILGRGRPVIAGRGDHTILVVASAGVTISGLAIEHVVPLSTEDRAGIRLEGATGCRIEDNEVRDTYFGIYGAKVDDCRIVGNRVTGPRLSEQASGNAIQFWNSDRITIQGNTVTGHRDGIYLEFVTESLLEDNESRNNRRYGLHFMSSHGCTYRRNRFIANGAGVAVMYTKRVVMEANEFVDNRGPAAYGLLLKDISDSDIRGNSFRGNSTGLYLEGANRLAVSANRFEGNGWAVRLLANSVDNRFETNGFFGNAFDVATNSRAASSTFSANYWDQYRGFDRNRDGKGDVPHRPVRLFSLVVEKNDPALILLRSLFVDLLDQAERVLPILTPETLVDLTPLMEPP